jgi:hypothetical protein
MMDMWNPMSCTMKCFTKKWWREPSFLNQTTSCIGQCLSHKYLKVIKGNQNESFIENAIMEKCVYNCK